MLTLQDLLDVAARYDTPMSRAMREACLATAAEVGVTLRVPRGRAPISPRGRRPETEVDWELLVRCNSDTRWMHQ